MHIIRPYRVKLLTININNTLPHIDAWTVRFIPIELRITLIFTESITPANLPIAQHNVRFNRFDAVCANICTSFGGTSTHLGSVSFSLSLSLQNS